NNANIEASNDCHIENIDSIYEFDSKNIKQASIHFQSNENKYLKADVLGFAIQTENQVFEITEEEFKQNKDLHEWLEREEVSLSAYDVKKTIVLSHRLGVKIKGVTFDTMLASYIL